MIFKKVLLCMSAVTMATVLGRLIFYEDNYVLYSTNNQDKPDFRAEQKRTQIQSVLIKKSLRFEADVTTQRSLNKEISVRATEISVTAKISMKTAANSTSAAAAASRTVTRNMFDIILNLTTNPSHWNSSHIVYIKVHKAASSTIQSILMRYGMKRSLNFALPRRSSNHLGWPGQFSRYRHMNPKITNPDVLCYHSVLSPDLIRTMPNDSFFLTSLRDPFTQIISSYEYYNAKNCDSPQKDKPLMELIKRQSKKCRGSIMMNPQSFDLGMDFSQMNDEETIHNMVKAVDKLFHFVVIVDYFDECLILLRDLLGLANFDIMYFKSNFHGGEKDNTAMILQSLLPEDTPQNRAEIYQYLKADYAVYKHFKQKIEMVISRKRDYLNAELQAFKQMQNTLMQFCIWKSVPSRFIKDHRFHPYGVGSNGYILTEEGLKNKTCVELCMVELPFTKVVAQYQNNLLEQGPPISSVRMSV